MRGWGRGGRRGSGSDTRRRWPKLRPAEVMVVALLGFAAIGAGISVGGSAMGRLLDLLCTVDRCQPVGLAAVGWAVVGGTMVLAGVLYRHARPGRTALYALVGCVVLMSFGLTVVLGGADIARELPPQATMLWVGLVAGLVPLLLVGPPRRADQPRPRRRSRDEPDPGRPLLLVNIGQGVTLAGVLIWAAILG